MTSRNLAMFLTSLLLESACDRRCPWGADVHGRVPPDGTLQWCEKEVDGSYRKHGQLIAWYQSGQRHGEATYDLGKLDGHVRVWWPDGVPNADFEFKQGAADGHWTLRTAENKLSAEGDTSEGKRVGIWKTYWEGGERQLTVGFDPGAAPGAFKVTYPSGDPMLVSEGDNGDLTAYSPEGKVTLIAHFRGGKPAGTWLAKYPSGQKRLEANLDVPVDDPNSLGKAYELRAYWPSGMMRAKYQCYFTGIFAMAKGGWTLNTHVCESWSEDGKRQERCEPDTNRSGSWCFDEWAPQSVSWEWVSTPLTDLTENLMKIGFVEPG